MKQIIVFLCLIISSSLIFSCSSKSENNKGSNRSNTSYSNSSDDEDSDENVEKSTSACKFEDGTYSATVDYNNPSTGYSSQYTLDVEVQDCQVIQINFPNDGYLDDDHITYADIDDDGNASVYGEEGKTYEIQIDNL